MQFRKLGTTDLNISLICLGTMNYGEQVAEKDAHQQLDYAIAQEIPKDCKRLWAIWENSQELDIFGYDQAYAKTIK